MDKSREGKRGTMAALLGNGGLSRRRHRNGSCMRDSPDEGGAMELHNIGKLRDRSSKSDRDRDIRDRYRDRDSRSKRSRVDRFIHGSVSGKGEDSAEVSGDDEEEEGGGEPGVSLQMQPPSPSPPSSTTLTNLSQQSLLVQAPTSVLPNHQHKRSLQAKVTRSPAVWKVADEMIGVSIPRKARSAAKRSSHELSVSGSGGGGGGSSAGSGGGEAMMTHRQSSASPARPNPTSTAPISPASSSAFLNKKVKIVSGNKHRQLKISNPPVAVQDIEFEVAEVLFGMTRQFQDSPKQEVQKQEPRETNGLADEANSQISSPKSFSTATDPCHSSILSVPSLSPSGAPFPRVALPKRKKTRPVKLADESHITPQNEAIPTTSVSFTGNVDDQHTNTVEVPLLKLEKSMAMPVMMTCTAARDISLLQNSPPESMKREDVASLASNFPAAMVDGCSGTDTKDEVTLLIKKPSKVGDIADCHNASEKTVASAADGPWEERFKIDLMALPPGKLYPEVEVEAAFVIDHKASVADMKESTEYEKGEMVDRGAKLNTAEHLAEEMISRKISVQDHGSKEQSSNDRNLFLQLDIKKVNVDGPNASNQQQAFVQQYKSPRDTKPDAVQVGTLSLSMSVAASAGRLCPSIGYMGQLPYIQTTYLPDGSNRSSKTMQPSQHLFPQIRSKHCATHCYIAHNIYYHQQIARMNTFLASSPGGMPLLGCKSPYNLNAVPPSESILVNQFQESFSGRSVATIQNKACSTAAQFGGQPVKDNILTTNALFIDEPQQKHLVLQQAPDWSSSSSVLHAPAFVSPLNQRVEAAAAAATATRCRSAKQSADTSGNVANSTSAAMISASARASETAVSFKYPNLPPNEAQYLAILQNNGCHFPIAAHAEAVPQFRGGTHAQVMPFFSGSFYGSHMIHPSQLHQHPQMQQIRQGHSSTSTSSASTHSHRHHQQLQSQQHLPKVGITGSNTGPFGALILKPRKNLQSDSSCPLNETAGTGVAQSAADGTVSNSQKGQMSSKFSGSIQPQQLALMSQTPPFGSGGSQGDKRHPIPAPQQKMEIDLTSPHTLAMPFASSNGTASSAASQGLEFSSLAQGHPLFQKLPEATRHGYRISPAAIAVSQQKMSHQEDGKASSMTFEEDMKMTPSGKTFAGFSQYSLPFSRAENEAPIASILIDSAVDGLAPSSNLIPTPTNGNRASDNHFSGSTPSIVCAGSASSSNPHQHKQQQQHFIQQLQKQQQHLTLQGQSTPSSNNTSGVLSDHISSTPLVGRFPASLSGFPQTIHGNISNSYTQWKNSSRTAAAAVSAPLIPSPVKNQLPQQQERVTHVASLSGGNQTQISFGLNSEKTSQSGEKFCGGINNLSPPSGTTVVVSSQSSVHITAGGNPSSSSSGKHVYQTLPVIQHHMPPLNTSPSSSGCKSSPTSNRNMPSIVGHSKTNHPIQASSKSQQQLQKHSFPRAHLSSSTAHAQGHSSHTKAASATATTGFFQKNSSEQQLHHQPTNSTLISIPAATATFDSTKAVAAAAAAASSIKGLLPSQTVIQAAQMAAIAAHSTAAAVMTGGPHALMTVPGYPFIQAMSNVSIKSAEQNSTAGNDNSSDRRQSEKK